MLSKRLIAVILLRDGRAVKSRQFANYRDVGDPVSQARIYYANGIDELVILNTQSEKGIQPLLDVLPKISEQCFIPIAAGGGVRSVNDAKMLVKHGAEKVVVRTAVDQIPAIADALGSQSVVQCFDHMAIGAYYLMREKDFCAGEALFQNIELDGMMTGYGELAGFSEVPVIRLGGCGTYQHMLDAFNAGADACAAGSLWAFTDSNPIRAKKWLKNHGVNVRT
jgi:imidazole glycerol-phosphate synthase subunit HisF